MIQWTFIGRVMPERIPVGLGKPIGGDSQCDELGFTFRWLALIKGGQIAVDVTLLAGETDIRTLRNLVEGSVQSVVDVLGYVSGFALDVQILSAVKHDDGNAVIFGDGIPILAERREGADRNELEADLIDVAPRNAGVQIALSEFRKAVGPAVETGLHCYRAIEAMMQSVKVNPKEADAAAWTRLRDALHVTRAAIELIKPHADPARHGRPTAITDAERGKVLAMTDDIIARYLQYLRGGAAPLPQNIFPLLAP